MIDCTRAAGLLDDYVDGDLPEPAAREVGGHLAACPDCARAESELRALLRRAVRLAPELEASHDLWPGIRDRIAARPAVPGRARPSTALWLGAAAVLLVALSSAATLWLVRHGSAPVTPPPRQTPELVALRASEPDFLQARKALYGALEQRRGRLAPETMKVIEHNLAVMDEALRAMKAALDRDPGNRGLAVLVESTYRQEIQLLMRATSLPADV